MPGTAAGRNDGRPSNQEGGLAIRINTVDQGVRNNVNLVDTPGVRWTASPPDADIMDVSAEIDAEVKLGPTITGIDLTAAGATQILAALAATFAMVTRIVLIAEDIQVVSVQPSVRAQTDGTLPGNLAAGQALAFTANGQVRELTLVDPRPGLDPGPSNFDQVLMDTTAQATATAYLVTAQVWGVVLTP